MKKPKMKKLIHHLFFREKEEYDAKQEVLYTATVFIFLAIIGAIFLAREIGQGIVWLVIQIFNAI